jgi:hypothetical protein
MSSTASSVASRSCRAASTPGSAPPAAGPHGIASIWAIWRPGASALVWSVTAMSEATDRLPRVWAWNRPRAFAVISEAVWWVTIVDATLVRHHPDTYDAVMTGQAPAQRQVVEETLAGLRFVRNRIGDQADLGEFIEPGDAGPSARQRRITGWAWKPVPEPRSGHLRHAGRRGR